MISLENIVQVKPMKIKSFLLATLLLISLLSGCAKPEHAQIAATTLPVYQFTQQLCAGTGISVTRLVTESVSCLHDYSLNVAQVKAVEQAEMVIISGAGLEGFMEDILDGAKTVIDSSAGIELLGCEPEHEHDHDHHHHEQDAHIWLSPINAKIMAANICEGLIKQFPEHEDTFKKNLSALHAELDTLFSYGETQLKDLSRRELVTFHDGFGYFADAFHLTILEAIEEESGSEASAQELIHLIELVEEHKLPAVFTEANGSVSAADIIAAETGATAFALDMAMAGDNYFDAMYHNIDTIREALG
jgi:ABC-type Zn uptake system ZnuABC Zn-binding protein ZnuA